MRPGALFNVASTLVTAGAITGASPTPNHIHQHLHAVKRTEIYKTVEVEGPTVVAFVLNGKIVGQNEVCDGISRGDLQWEDPNSGPEECSSSSTGTIAEATVTPTAAEIAESTVTSTAAQIALSQPSVAAQETQEIKAVPDQFSQAPQPSITQDSSTPSPLTTTAAVLPDLTTSSDSAPTVSSSTAETLPRETSYPQSSSITDGQGLEREFPDGEIDCSTFPSEYGPIEVKWANLGGWAGIQYVTVEGDMVTHIVTAVPGGKGCIPGAMCSYACPPGYQKSQWPSTQGSTGQSVGGIQCNSNGKLTLTNPELSKTLCIKGTGATHVQNKLSYNAAICRTDYPGTENEIVPLNTQPESTSPLTCPDANNYFRWKGLPTTAQYYINNQGIALHDACMWGTDGSNMGNWAPTFLGVGQDVYGKTWLSISSTAQNNPISYSPLNYTVTIQGDTSGNCRVSNGKYCSGDNFDNCNEQGCTVELMSGEGTYVLSD